MELTVFPPFNVTVDAVDALTALGGAIRLSADGVRLRIESEAPLPADLVFGCPGVTIAVEPALLPRVREATLGYDELLGFTVDGMRRPEGRLAVGC